MLNMMGGMSAGGNTHLTPLDFTGPNPGALEGFSYIPADLPANAPLVVVLHGCTQTAAGFDLGTGWTTLADRGQFAVLFPQQTRSNNPNLCFNWFTPGDIGRTGGEAESIAEMIRHMTAEHRLNASRVYVTGLSAGGAMTAVMLAAYPELFAGGAIIGGLPYGSATGVPQALERMRGQGQASDERLESVVRKVSGEHAGPWPTVSLWHGTADATVAIANMDGLGRQWRALHGVGGAEPVVADGAGWEHRSWAGSDGKPVVEEWSITGMGHGVPLDTRGEDAVGQAGAYMLDAGISSTAVIAHSWNLIEAEAEAEAEAQAEARPAKRVTRLEPIAAKPRVAPRASSPAQPRKADLQGRPGGVQTIIEDALRAAGLMK
jgi:poly(hydroxyalkanoate) depolymerase family esterase